jgi:NitT/TauT family transport system substrate-binding protein
MKIVASLRLVAALAVGATALVACGSSSNSNSATTGADGLTVVRVANLPAAATQLLQVADEQGFLKANGIKAEITQSSELSTFIPALGKQYDVVMTTPSDFLASATKGFDIGVLGGAWADGAGVYSKTAKSIADLAGKKIATNSLAGLQYAMLADSLATAKVTAQLVQVPFASQPDQLKAGQVDAATVPEPWASALAEAGYTRIFTPIEQATGEKNALTGWFSTTKAFASAHPAVVTGWRAAMTSAIDWVGKNDAKFREMLTTNLKLDAKTAADLQMPTFTAVPTADNLKVYVGPLVRQKQLDAAAEKLDLSTYIVSA